MRPTSIQYVEYIGGTHDVNTLCRERREKPPPVMGKSPVYSSLCDH